METTNIVRLEFKRMQLRLAHPWTIARARGTTSCTVIDLALLGPEGSRGQGEAAPVARYDESPDTVEAFLNRADPDRLSTDDIAASMDYLRSLSADNMSAKCALNVALLDLAAKLARKPLHQFLGLGFQEKQHVTSFSIGIDNQQAIREKVLAASGYPVLKMKVGVPEDKANLMALREIAPAKPVRLDANEGWRTKERALEMLEYFARDQHLQFVEQPMPASVPEKDWIWLKQRSPLPIFGDESYHVAKDADRAARCFHGVNVKLVKAGGITAAVEALQAARARGLKTMLGCMIETSLLVTAAAHLAELCDYLDLDGNLLITNDPYLGVTAEKGILSFSSAPEKFGLRVSARC
jgi:L-alanine-DL-glutamate epimerase-like enolase superfamily enzyme